MIITFKNLRRAVAAIALVGTFVVAGCTGEIEERVSKLEDRVASLEQLTQALNAKLGDNLLVKSVTSVGGGWDIVFSNDSRIEVRPPVDGEDGEDGADGVSPKIKVAPNGDDGLSIWYNITKDYPESGWVNTEINIQGEPGESGLDISSLFEMQITDDGKLQYTLDGETWVDVLDVSGLGGTAIVVRENPDGTVTFVTADGEYTFAQAQVVMTAINSIEVFPMNEVGSGNQPIEAIRVRISPSNAPIPAVGMWTLDDISALTRADYRNPSKLFQITEIAKEKKEDVELDGQYIIKVKGLGVGDDIDNEEHDLALVLNIGTTSSPVLLSSSPFVLVLKEGELNPDADMLKLIEKGLNDDGYANPEEDYEFAFTASAPWTITVIDRATGKNAEWVDINDKYTGADDESITVELDPNKGTGAKARSAIVTITTKADKDDKQFAEFSFVINQEAAVDVLTEGGLTEALVDALKVLLGPTGGGGIDILDDGKLSKTKAAGVKDLNFTYDENDFNFELTGDDLAGFAEAFPNLEELTLSGHEELGGVDLSGLEKLSILTIVEGGLTSITMPAHAKDAKENLLTEVTITGNEDLKSIDLSKAAKLTKVILSENGLTSVPMPAKANDLVTIELKDNKLTSFTLPTEAKKLESLSIENNELTGIDISMLDKTVFEELEVEGNPGLEKAPATRALGYTHEFKVKVWKGFDVEETGDLPAKDTKWDYSRTGKTGHGVELIYDVTPTNLPTSIVISPVSDTVTISGTGTAKAMAVTTAYKPFTLKATLAPADTDVKTVNWRSTEEDVATVTDGGVVTIKGVGETVIEALVTGKNGQISDKVTITVQPDEPAIITLTLPEGVDRTKIYGYTTTQDIPITAKVNDNASVKTIVWTTSDSDVATVSAGNVTFKGNLDAGKTVTITATINDGREIGEDAFASVTFTIVKFTPADIEKVEGYEDAAFTDAKKIPNLEEIVVGSIETVYLKPILNEGASITKIVWSEKTDGNSKFSIDEDGVVTIDGTAEATNTATFTATIEKGAANQDDVTFDITLTLIDGDE